MIINPHITCAQVLDTLKKSGLTYTLNETPYSVYLTLRKKFIKEYLHTGTQHAHGIMKEGEDTTELEDNLAKLQEAVATEIQKHNITKHQLSEMEARVEQMHNINDWNTEESNKQHLRHLAIISDLKNELAQEVDDHAQSESALKKLEEKIESLNLKLDQEMKHKASILEENDSLRERLEDAEQATENLNTMTRDLNAKLLRYELKQAELASLDSSLLNTKVRELEGTIEGKNRIISILKDQANCSLREIAQLRQNQSLYNSVPNHLPSLQSHSSHSSSSADTPASPSSQPSTPAGISQLVPKLQLKHNNEKDTNIKASDENDNLPPNKISNSTAPDSIENPSQSSPPTGIESQSSSHNLHFCTDPEKFCQNCKNKLSDDIDVEIPSPIYFYDFLSECPSPWLHYGYCTPCLEVARSTSTHITDHISQCEAFLDKCWDGEHEEHIAHYNQTEAEFLIDNKGSLRNTNIVNLH